MVEQIDHRLAQGVAFAGEQQIDDTEDVFVVERSGERSTDLFGRGRPALVVVARDRHDGERARRHQGADADQSTDQLALRPLRATPAVGRDRHHLRRAPRGVGSGRG